MMIFVPDAVLVLLTTADLGITGRTVVSAQALVQAAAAACLQVITSADVALKNGTGLKEFFLIFQL